jgi:hypothetical protein
MKKFLKYSVIVLLLLCVFLPGRFVGAQAVGTCNTVTTDPTTGKSKLGTVQTTQAACNTTTTPGAITWNDPSGGTPVAAGGATQAPTDINGNLTPAGQAIVNAQNQDACGFTNISACFSRLLANVAKFIFSLMALLLWVAGSMLDYVLNYTILQMSQNISGMTGINIVWKVIRDLSNIAFIFILLYEAILLIISKSDTAKIKGIIAGIVITALLINFSMFFTKIIIDASNVVTVGFYQSIIGANPQPTTTPSGTSSTANNFIIPAGISGAFINNMHVVNFIGSQDVTTLNKGQDYDSITKIAFGGSILFLVLAFVFFAVAIMYLVRYAVLIVLLMSAPLGYLGIGLPALKSTQSTWWNTLLGQCIFAPLWMFCCWAILTLVGSPGFLTLTGGSTLTSLSTGGAFSTLFSGANGSAQSGGIPLLINFGLIIGLVIGSLTLAKTKASQGSGLIAKYTGQATAFAGGAIMGGAAYGMRNNIGRAALGNSSVEELEAKAAEGGAAGAAAKARLAMAKGSYDIRRSFAGEQIAKATGTDFGKGLPFSSKAGEGGYAAAKADNKKTNDGEVDVAMKRYVDKRDWAGLAKFVKGRTDKYQEYVYKKLSERDRVSLDKALADPALTARLRSKLSMDDQIKTYVTNKHWGDLATFLKSKSPNEQEYIYEKLSARDRVALDGALADPVLTARLRDALSIEEKEKTEKSAKEEAKKTQDKQRFDNIDNLVAGRPTVPPGQTYDTLLGPGAKFSNKEARNLSLAALNNGEVIKRLSSRHLADIIANHDDIDEPTKKFIRELIQLSPSGSYPLHDEQIKYLGSNKGVEAAWGI